MPQARGQGDIKQEAVTDAKKAIRLCKSCLENQKKSMASKLITVSL